MKSPDKFYQWYIITVIGGKEDSIIAALKEKIAKFGYEDRVNDIKVFKGTNVKVQEFNKDSAELPKTLKNTKTTKWETLPNGMYRKTSTRVVNRYPGYVFVEMAYDEDVWYAIRNTNGVLGFVGSSGKGALPIPITIEEYASVETGGVANPSATTTTDMEQPEIVKPEVEETPKVYYETNYKTGMYVQVGSGPFAGTNGLLKSLDNTKGKAIVEIDFMGSTQGIEVDFADLKDAE